MVFFPCKQKRIMGLISGLIGGVAGVIGMHKAGKAQRQLTQAQSGILSQTRNLGNWYNQQANTDYMNTAAAKSGIAKARDNIRNVLSNARSNMAAGGATDESKVALKGQLNSGFNQFLSNLVGAGTRYQAAMKGAYGNSLNTQFGQNQSIYEPQIRGGQQLAQQGFSAFANGLQDAASNMTGTVGKVAKWLV